MITSTPHLRRTSVARQRLLNAVQAVEESTQFCMMYYAECNTPGCVLGWYAYREDLQSTFKLRYNREDGGNCGKLEDLQTGKSVDYNSEEVQRHFGISAAEALELFSTTGCGYAGNNKERAVAYLRQFIARKYPQWDLP